MFYNKLNPLHPNLISLLDNIELQVINYLININKVIIIVNDLRENTKILCLINNFEDIKNLEASSNSPISKACDF